MGNELRLTDVGAGLIPPFPTMVPVDVQRYHNAAAAAGATHIDTRPRVALAVYADMDTVATIDVGRELYLAGYTTDLPVADVDAQLAAEALRGGVG